MGNTAPRDRGRQRRGMSLIESAVALVLLGAVLVATAQVLQLSAAQYRAAERKRCALEAATTLLDRLTVRDFDAITQQNVAKLQLPEKTADCLDNPRLAVTVTSETQQPKSEQPPAKRVCVELNWTNLPSGRKDHVRLTTWVFQRGAAK